ncbi:DsbA family protein [Rhodophyticola porphyridii]|uniref:DsbA family protein n=1 Tax=Rhodophyticola porphyridii TaxID=1852017 RepID=A0A3L9XWP9_9RHOB|nr:DsbA family protein [Rhodophyticola porphyridii]RMA40732.1 DsbA family protein [Rhodophyticola porphyridii]
MKSFFAAALTGLMLILSGPALAVDLDALTDTERAAFRAEVRAYLLDNPEVLMEAIGVLEQRQAAAEAAQDMDLVAANAEALFNSETSWEGGNPEGDLVLVEFLDYRCGFCRRAFPEVERLLESDGNIRFVIKEFPILGEQSTLASRFALSTRIIEGDAAYKDLHDAMMVMRAEVSEESLSRIATELGFDAEAILAGIDVPEIDRVLEENYALAQRLQISGTPSFVMGDQLLRGYLPYEAMAELAEQVRAEAN